MYHYRLFPVSVSICEPQLNLWPNSEEKLNTNLYRTRLHKIGNLEFLQDLALPSLSQEPIA